MANDLGSASVGQIMIPVSDLERAVTFYRDTLGIQVLFTAPPQMSFFNAGNVRLLVGVPTPAHPPHSGGAVYFRVKDIETVHAELVNRGVAFAAPPHSVHRGEEYDLWLAEFQDPDGNVLALMEEKQKGVASSESRVPG